MALEPISSAMRVVHDEDPREEIWRGMGARPGEAWNKYGDLIAKARVGGEDVLVVRYERRGKSSGGIILPAQTSANDKWQGNTGLIVKMGPRAYKTDKTVRWFVEGEDTAPPQIGDWVFFDPNLSKGFMFGDRYCFLVPAQYVFLVLAEPDIVQ